MNESTKILTVAGKGGVGKTSISSAMVRILTEEYPDARILAIDADPAIGLTTAHNRSRQTVNPNLYVWVGLLPRVLSQHHLISFFPEGRQTDPHFY